VTTTTNKKKTDRQTDRQTDKQQQTKRKQTDKQTIDRHTANNKLYMTDKSGSLQYETKKNI
jgi:hypothetical protein